MSNDNQLRKLATTDGSVGVFDFSSQIPATDGITWHIGRLQKVAVAPTAASELQVSNPLPKLILELSTNVDLPASLLTLNNTLDLVLEKVHDLHLLNTGKKLIEIDRQLSEKSIRTVLVSGSDQDHFIDFQPFIDQLKKEKSLGDYQIQVMAA